jgi:hypothetical protein
MSSHSINDPKHWLDRAREARALAEQLDDLEAKRTMLKNANDYERLAQRAEERAAGRWPQSAPALYQQLGVRGLARRYRHPARGRCPVQAAVRSGVPIVGTPVR